MKGCSFRLLVFVVALLALVSLAFLACDSNKIYENNIKLPDEGWKQADIARFEAEIADTTAPCNVYVNVSNTSSYKWMELWLFVNVHAPSGTVQRDTLKVMIADEHGRWTGHGLGNRFDNRLLYGKEIRFPERGTYIFEYEQAMRDEPLIGIADIGLRIERAK